LLFTLILVDANTFAHVTVPSTLLALEAVKLAPVIVPANQASLYLNVEEPILKLLVKAGTIFATPAVPVSIPPPMLNTFPCRFWK
jgi:hypothetical protein